MEHIWQLQEAKNRFSEVVQAAQTSGPQIITKHGQEAAVVIGYQEYRRLQLEQEPLSAFFRRSPLIGGDIDLSRDQSGLRDDLEL
ncbi:type II toxin-antitoxin system prevent-host-death family antitoxin [Herpetosiphon giganteus]|uniref:type II toxin-antitoxin system prevent-host-death family antitoxin n=1 Tax=Herpetosiphon giganteus TaxID=2029754 RepID=UPI00195C066D|nr:prevent-host-death family protein [Herpetosiphon giganteus]